MTARQATRANDLALVVEAIADSIIEGALSSWRDARMAPRLRDEIIGHAAELLLELTNGEVDAVAEALLGEDLNIQIECGPVTA